MYFVIGNSPKRVELKDLEDCVYYKQQKVYSNEQYKRSIDLQRAIHNKVLVVLKKSEDSTGSFDLPSVAIPSEVNITSSNDGFKNIDILLNKIHKLEESLKEGKSSVEAQILDKILNRIENLERNPAPDNITLNSIQESIKNLESKLQEKNKEDDILEKLEGIINKVGTGGSNNGGSYRPVETTERRVEDVYVPNITVEDANSHINLEVRSIENSDNVSDALKKLKEMKSKKG